MTLISFLFATNTFAAGGACDLLRDQITDFPSFVAHYQCIHGDGGEMDQQWGRIAELQNQIDDLVADNTALRSENAAQQAVIDDLVAELMTTQADLYPLLFRMDTAENDLAVVHWDIGELYGYTSDNTTGVSDLWDEVNDFRDRFQVVESDLESLQTGLNTCLSGGVYINERVYSDHPVVNELTVGVDRMVWTGEIDVTNPSEFNQLGSTFIFWDVSVTIENIRFVDLDAGTVLASTLFPLGNSVTMTGLTLNISERTRVGMVVDVESVTPDGSGLPGNFQFMVDAGSTQVIDQVTNESFSGDELGGFDFLGLARGRVIRTP